MSDADKQEVYTKSVDDGKRLIFGCGTGRCGTKSFQRLMSAQHGTYFTHEKLRLPWEADFTQCLGIVRKLLTRPEGALGDIAYWYLTYVSELVTRYDAYIVILRRDKQLTVESILRQRYDYFSSEPAPEDIPPDWIGGTTPRFPGTRIEAVSAWWDMYYASAGSLENLYPRRVKVVALDQLNSHIGQRELLRWLAYDNKHIRTAQLDPRYPMEDSP
ncbi:MAG: hypothetical protein QGH25_06265 [Candidatus Latescibacteria bacterium]|jgi:hypothetical protein|nr:hypothetical protein [Candidatus Latescibacterota bacterium]